MNPTRPDHITPDDWDRMSWHQRAACQPRRTTPLERERLATYIDGRIIEPDDAYATLMRERRRPTYRPTWARA